MQSEINEKIGEINWDIQNHNTPDVVGGMGGN
jgi:hypothetical protein